MHRQALLEKLKHYTPADPEDRACLARFVRFVNGHPDCFENHLAIGHITGSAWIVDGTRQRTLLTHHRKLDKWVQLGGHSDGNPNTLDTALREAQEESGLTQFVPVSTEIFDLDIHPIPARYDEPRHLHYDVRYALQAQDDALVISDESVGLAWVPIRELQHYSQERSMLRMRQKWLNISHPHRL